MAVTDETKKVIKKEISRLNKERDEIEKTIKRLEDALVSTTRKAGRTARKAVGRPRKTGAKRGRKPAKSWKPSGRAAEILKIIKANPGITTSEIAKKIKVKSPANVYPPLNKLKDNGYVKKSGKGFAAK